MLKFRDVLRQMEQTGPTLPILPFIPVFLKVQVLFIIGCVNEQDLLFMHEGNTDKVEKMVNFDKLRMVAKHVLV